MKLSFRVCDGLILPAYNNCLYGFAVYVVYVVGALMQISTLEVMTRYVRRHFSDPAPGVAAAIKLQAQQRSSAAAQGNHSYIRKRRVVRKAFYSDEEDESEEEHVEEIINPEIGSVFTGGEADNEGDLDPDHRLILKSSLPLLKSRNSGVVLSVCALHYYCGTQKQPDDTEDGQGSGADFA